QLTNILRDLAEDAQRGRIYLPRDEMERFGYSEADLLAGRADESFDRLMAFQIERARGYYERSSGLEERLSADCRATSWAMTRIYRGLLERIARQPRMVLQKRVRLGSVRKLSIAAQALWRRGRPG
ncbi:MAG TPA: squalene/phytoene synthase family protein, partial [Phycisphaeraceae bacterium]